MKDIYVLIANKEMEFVIYQTNYILYVLFIYKYNNMLI